MATRTVNMFGSPKSAKLPPGVQRALQPSLEKRSLPHTTILTSGKEASSRAEAGSPVKKGAYGSRIGENLALGKPKSRLFQACLLIL